MGVTPTLAAGQPMNAATPAQAPAQEEAVQVVLPEGGPVGDTDLNDVEGAGPELYYVFRSVALGAGLAAGGYIASQKLKGKRVDPKIVVAKAIYGAGMGLINGTLGVAKKTIEYGGRVAKYVYTGLQWTFKAASSSASYLWNKAMGK